ncbi:MAG TPA: mechanosensitive ion channel, partial [Anaerolineaceae bacterium]
MDNPFTNLGLAFTGYLPTILAALAVLLVGWLIAFVVSRLVGNLLERTNLDDRVAGMLRTEQNTAADGPRVTRWVTTAVFWIILLFAVVAFLQVLNLSIVSAPLNLALSSIIGFLPSLFSALVLLFVAFLVATFLRMIVTRVVSASSLSRRASENAEMSTKSRVTLGETVGNVVYWLVFLLFLPAILGALNLNGILAPVQTMVNEVLAFLPNLLAAGLILAVGYFAARIVRQIVVGLLNSVGVNRIGQQVGLQGENAPNLANALGTLVMVLIMIPVAIAALNALDIPAVSQPAAAMLTTVLNAIPLIFGAAVLIAITYFAARLVGNLVAGLLAGMGFDRLFRSLGLGD